MIVKKLWMIQYEKQTHITVYCKLVQQCLITFRNTTNDIVKKIIQQLNNYQFQVLLCEMFIQNK